MNRRGFFSAIASAVAAGIVIPRESIIVAPPPLIVQPRDYLREFVDKHSFLFNKHAFTLVYPRAFYRIETDEETGIHVRLFPDPAQRMDIQAEWVSPIEEITRDENARRYPEAARKPTPSE
jgi:hypothetical protein